jgi:predicted porin
VFYDSPNFSGFQILTAMSTTTTASDTVSAAAQTVGQASSKPRTWGVAGTYNNGPLYLNLGYEKHSNFSPNSAAVGFYGGEDRAYQVGAAYQIGPVKVGLLYVDRQYDMSANGATSTKVKAWNLAGEWRIVGPHALRGGYTKANDTSGSGNSGATLVGGAGGGLVANAGAGGTGGKIWQAQYVYNASKRTELTAGYVKVDNDSNARYGLGGITAPAAGQDQHAFAVSIKNTF